MKNIKLYIAILIGLFALTVKGQSYNFDNPVRITSWLQVTKNHPGTSANRIFGVSGTGPGVTGSYGNYIYLTPALLSNDSLIIPGVSPGHPATGGYWTRTGGRLYPTTLTDSVGIGTATPAYKLHIDGTFYETWTDGTNTGVVQSNPDESFSVNVNNAVFSGILQVRPDLNTISQSNGSTSISSKIQMGITNSSFGGGVEILTSDGTDYLAAVHADTLGYVTIITDNIERARINNSGNVGIGTATPAAVLDVTSTTSGFLPPRMTGAERDAIATPVNGMILYNSTTDKLQVRAAGAWVDLH